VPPRSPFFGSTVCNYVVICRAHGTCGQRPSLCFVRVLSPLAGSPLLGGGRAEKFLYRCPNPLSVALLPTCSTGRGIPTHRTSHQTGCRGKKAVVVSGHSLQSSARIISNNARSLLSTSLYFFMARCWVREAINKWTSRHIYGHSSAHYHSPNSTMLFTVRCGLWNFGARFTAFPGTKFCRKQQFKSPSTVTDGMKSHHL